MTVVDDRPVVSAGPLQPGCPVWCVSNHADPLMDSIHVSRTAEFAPPSDMEADGEFLAAELFSDSDLSTPRTYLSLNHGGNSVLLDAAGVDQTVHDLLEFVVRLKALRAQMGAA
jgi:hypothetical protein